MQRWTALQCLGHFDFQLVTPVITLDQNAILVNMVSRKEIEQAFLSIHLDKSPGLDDFSALFF